MGLLDDEGLGAAFGNEMLRRRATNERARMLARQQEPSLPPDINSSQFPRVNAAIQGLLGTAPDEMGISVLNPQAESIKAAADPAYVIGMALQGLPIVGGALKALGAGPKLAAGAESYMGRMGMMPGVVEKGGWPIDVPGRSGITATSKQEVKGLADSFADSVREMGFDATVDHSGSKAGASSYVRINDPQTGRFINKPIRISDHSKGTKELQGVIEILNPASDFEKVFSMLQDMRSQGPAASMVQNQLAEKLIAEGVKPKTAYRRASEEALQQQPALLPQQLALELAQQRAALPVSKGGLGLPADNTAQQRAAAMKFDKDAYHATDADILAFDNSKLGINTRYWSSGDLDAVKSAKRGHWFSDRDLTNIDPRGYMLGNVSYPVKLANPKKINDKEFGSQSYIVKNPDNIRSRFAAFDPFRRTAATAALMGVAAPDLLASEITDEEKKRQLAGLLYP